MSRRFEHKVEIIRQSLVGDGRRTKARSHPPPTGWQLRSMTEAQVKARTFLTSFTRDRSPSTFASSASAASNTSSVTQ